MDYHYLQCATMLVAASELTALTSPLEGATCRAGYGDNGENSCTGVPDSPKPVFRTTRAFHT